MLYNQKPTLLGKLRDLKPELPILLSSGLVYATLQLFTSWVLGPELPCLIAGGGTLIFYVLIEKVG